ncbi:MAG: NADH-quinone oxidoreductase subunit H [Bacteroidales bacterium]|nr:NADH-quinone oxidoreductase subunit H [Bacteroidales bacterium]
MLGVLLILSSAIFFPGITAKVKARLGGRKMPHLFQPLFDVVRQFKKRTIYSPVTSIIFKMAPIIYFASVLVAIMLIPLGEQKGLISFDGDFVFFAYILALGRFMMIIGAMDTGSGFEGMGANREAFYALLVEPAFFILMGSMALFTGFPSFSDLYSNMHINTNLSYITGIAAIYVLMYTAMVENSRLPVDDPKTHLELTMIHEVMILDNSGFDLSLMYIASWLKFAVFGALISNFLIYTSWSIYIQIIVFYLIQFVFAVVVGMLESFRARNKMDKNPQWILMLSAISIVIFLTTLIITQKIILN